MAFIYPDSVCQICGKKLGDNYDENNIVGLPEGIFMLTEFSVFNDNVIHQSCFQVWKKAEEFVDVLNSELKRSGRKEFLTTEERKLKYA